MKIFICGLGLIGGSFAKAIKERTLHTVIGTDKDASVIDQALEVGAIDAQASTEDLGTCDLILIALYPKAAIEFVRENLGRFKPGAILLDTCGIKTEVCTEVGALIAGTSLHFIGGHPMAGIEHSGFDYAFASLFEGASMILCTEACTDIKAVETVSELCKAIGFCRITRSTCAQHDKIIAFTSQLAHVVSSAYAHGKYATEHSGFSAGSFRDMTRVARLNPDMWTELFFENRENLAGMIEELIENLQKYKAALDCGDREAMHKLLADGNARKIQADRL